MKTLLKFLKYRVHFLLTIYIIGCYTAYMNRGIYVTPTITLGDDFTITILQGLILEMLYLIQDQIPPLISHLIPQNGINLTRTIPSVMQ